MSEQPQSLDAIEIYFRGKNALVRPPNKTEGRKLCTIVENCSAHPHLKLENTELVFLPPNTTSHIQLMDNEIIKNSKFFSRQILADRRFQLGKPAVNPNETFRTA